MSRPPQFESLLRRNLSIGDDEELPGDANLFDPGVDSRSMLRLLVDIEETFDIEIPDQELDLEIFDSVDALWNTVSALDPGDSPASGRP